MERALRLLDWLALTRRGQITAGAIELAGIALTVGLPRLGRRLSRSAHTTQEDPA